MFIIRFIFIHFMKIVFRFFIFLFCVQLTNAQDVGIGQWQDFLSYKNALAVAEGGGKVYCATQGGVFSLEKSDHSIQRLTKINGLGDIEATVLGFNTYSNKLFIAYKNSNIDIVENGSILNLSDIKRKAILGNKSINNVYFINQYAYLACGFGIVVVDMNKIEVSDTYYIGPDGSSINVRDITSDDTYFYAATNTGIYRALKSNPNLANYSSWSLMNGLPVGIYNSITEFNGKIYANFSKYLATGATGQDTTYVYENAVWTAFTPSIGQTVKFVRKQNTNVFLLGLITKLVVYDSLFTVKETVDGYLNDYTKAEQAVVDNVGDIYIADANHGMVLYRPNSGIDNYLPDGPRSNNVVGMDIKDNKLIVAPGGGGNNYFADGIYTYNGENWSNIRGDYPSVLNIDSIPSISYVVIDPINTSKAYASSGFSGIIELENGVPTALHNQNNSSLTPVTAPGYSALWTAGLAFDANNNLWVGNSGVPTSVSVKKNDNTWQALNFSTIIGSAPYIGQILVDKSDQKWVVLARGSGLMVYNGTGSTPNSSNTKKLTTSTGNGALPSTNVFCLAEDADGEIWVGTDKGITVFYSPEAVFSGDNYDSQQILIEQDGHVQILLETELIQSIAIDGANRKWIATQNSGVFLMSEDGTKEILHFDISNSPLFSNDVKSIAINHQTGEVFFGTAKGIITYRSSATGGSDFFTDVYSFPNPVKPGYDGPIAIKGLVTNSIVKITDINGSLVYETVSEGGQAIWYAKNFKGERVNSGVYMVFCTSQDGTQKIATKILVVN
jgi:hypothetical protein